MNKCESGAQAPAHIHTYPEMNETLKDLLRHSEEPMNLYILARIEELENQLAAAVKDIWNFSTGNTCRSCTEWKEGRCSRPGPKDCAGYNWWKWRGFAEGGDTTQHSALDKAIERMESVQDETGYDLLTVQECLRLVKAAALEKR